MWASEEKGPHSTPARERIGSNFYSALTGVPRPPPPPAKATDLFPCLQVTLYYNRIKVYLTPLLAYFSPILPYLRLPAGFDQFCILLANRRAQEAKKKKVEGTGVRL